MSGMESSEAVPAGQQRLEERMPTTGCQTPHERLARQETTMYGDRTDGNLVEPQLVSVLGTTARSPCLTDSRPALGGEMTSSSSSSSPSCHVPCDDDSSQRPDTQPKYTLAHSYRNTELALILSRGKNEENADNESNQRLSECGSSIDASQIVEPTGRLTLGADSHVVHSTGHWVPPIKNENERLHPSKQGIGQVSQQTRDLGGFPFKVEPASFGSWEHHSISQASYLTSSTPAYTVTSCGETKFTLAPSKLQGSGLPPGQTFSSPSVPDADICSSRTVSLPSSQCDSQRQELCNLVAPAHNSQQADYYAGVRKQEEGLVSASVNPNAELSAAAVSVYAFDQKPSATAKTATGLDTAVQPSTGKVNCEGSKDLDLEGLEFDGDTVLCRVCGDKASGFHYGVHACEGCKGFFRRSIQQKIQYRPCLKNQQCTITRVNRNRCQYCRLKKCISVGMSRDAVRFGRVPKKEKAKIQQRMDEVNKQAQVVKLDSVLQSDADILDKIMEAHFKLCEFTQDKLRTFMNNAWKKAEFVNCPVHVACPLNPSPENSDGVHQWEEFSDCITPAIRSVVSFAKSIPGFEIFSQEDQVTLLKAGTFEVLLVHLARLFDDKTNTMVFVNGKLFKRVAMAVTNSAGFLLDSMFDFATRMNELNLDDKEIGLFSALVIVSPDRPGLRSVEHVERIQSRVLQGLQMMMKVNHPDDQSAFQKLLLKIPDLRTLNTLHSEKLLVPQTPANSPGKTEAAFPVPQDRVTLVNISKAVSSFFPNPLVVPPSLQAACAATYSGIPVPNPMFSPTAADGAPIVPHQVALEAKQKELVLQTPQGTFHRHQPVVSSPLANVKTEHAEPLPMDEERRRQLEEALLKNEMFARVEQGHQGLSTPGHTPAPSARNSRSCSPEPHEFDMPASREHATMPHLAHMMSEQGQKAWQQEHPRVITDSIYSEKKKRPYDDREGEIDNKAQRIEDGMRSQRSNSVGGNCQFGTRPRSDSVSSCSGNWDYNAHRARSNSLSTRFERSLKLRTARAHAISLSGDRSSRSNSFSMNERQARSNSFSMNERQARSNSFSINGDRQARSNSFSMNERQARSNSFSMNERQARSNSFSMHERQARSNSFSVNSERQPHPYNMNSDYPSRSNSFSLSGERPSRSNSFSINGDDMRSSRSNSFSNWEYDMRQNRSDSMSSSASLESYDSGYRTNPPTPRNSIYEMRPPYSMTDLQMRLDACPVTKATTIVPNPRDDISQIPEENEECASESDKGPRSLGRDLPTLKSVLTSPTNFPPNQWFLKSRVGFVERRGGLECGSTGRSSSPSDNFSKRYRKMKMRQTSSECNSPDINLGSSSDDQKSQSPLAIEYGERQPSINIPRVEITDTSKHAHSFSKLVDNVANLSKNTDTEGEASVGVNQGLPKHSRGDPTDLSGGFWQAPPGLGTIEERERTLVNQGFSDQRPRSYSHSDTTRSAVVSLKDKILNRIGSRENLHRDSASNRESPMEMDKPSEQLQQQQLQQLQQPSGEGASGNFRPYMGGMPYPPGVVAPHPAYYPMPYPQVHPMYFFHAMQQYQALQAQQQQQQQMQSKPQESQISPESHQSPTDAESSAKDDKSMPPPSQPPPLSSGASSPHTHRESVAVFKPREDPSFIPPQSETRGLVSAEENTDVEMAPENRDAPMADDTDAGQQSNEQETSDDHNTVDKFRSQSPTSEPVGTKAETQI